MDKKAWINGILQCLIRLVFIMIYDNLKKKPKDEMQNSQRPNIKAKHQWY